MPALKRKQPSVNLLPTDEGDSSLKGRIIRWLLGTFRFLVITVELVVIVGFLSRFFLDSQNSDLTDNINEKKALIQSYLPFEKDFKRTQKRIELLNNYAYTSTPLGDFVSQTTRNIPTDVQITRINKTGEEITITIVAKDEQAIVAFASRIQKESLLQNVSVLSVESVQNSSLIQANLKTELPKTQTNEEQPS